MTTPDTTSMLVPLFLLAIAVLAAGVLIQPHIARYRRARRARRQAVAWQAVQPADDGAEHDETAKDAEDELAMQAMWHRLRSHPDANLQRGVIVESQE